jgi:hypothetical protein
VIPFSLIDTDFAIKSSFSGLPPPATPILPTTFPLYQIGEPPLKSNSSGSVFKFLINGLLFAFCNNSSVGVLVDNAV